MLFGTYDPDNAAMAECIGLRRRRLDGPQPKPECPGDNPQGGVRALPLTLRAALEEGGAELRLGWEVEQIAIDGGRAVGVVAHQRRQPFQQYLSADAVVCNVPVWRLLDLVAPGHFPPRVRRRRAALRRGRRRDRRRLRLRRPAAPARDRRGGCVSRLDAAPHRPERGLRRRHAVGDAALAAQRPRRTARAAGDASQSAAGRRRCRARRRRARRLPRHARRDLPRRRRQAPTRVALGHPRRVGVHDPPGAQTAGTRAGRRRVCSSSARAPTCPPSRWTPPRCRRWNVRR